MSFSNVSIYIVIKSAIYIIMKTHTNQLAVLIPKVRINGKHNIHNTNEAKGDEK